MDVLSRLDEIRAATNVLEHPFYQRWSAGELSASELASYAGEYRLAVIALAEASTLAAAKAQPARAGALREHAEEERAHVELWDEFARAAGTRLSGDSARALPETEECARVWRAGENLLDHLAVLYVIEAGQPEIARTKLEGLTAHYGYSDEGPATEYFRLHELLDREHSREAAELIAELMAEVEDPEQKAEQMVSFASAALRGNWLLLDGVSP